MKVGPPAGGPLRGRRVLLTRPRRDAAGLSRLLEAMGASVDVKPTIALAPSRDAGAVSAALSRLQEYDVLIFTSPNGARFFEEALHRAGLVGVPARCRTAAVGPGTARALRDAGIEPGIVARESRAEGLAAELARTLPQGSRGLWVRPEEAREALARDLAAAGIRVDPVAFYRTDDAPEGAEAAAGLARGDYDAVVFASPSSLGALLRAGGDARAEVETALRRAARIAIGEVTAEAMEKAGFPATAIARAPSNEGIASAVRLAFDR